MLELRGVTKTFGEFTALHQVDFAVQPGEIVGLLGENGAGKSTLMNLVGGVLRPTSGQIFLDGKALQLTSPRQATAIGIGVVHQHFMLLPGFTVAENVALHTDKTSQVFNAAKWQNRIAQWAEKLGWKIDGSRLVEELNTGERQRVEILKALFGSTNSDEMAKLLLLDEPTANLTPQETEELFTMLRALRDRGCGIVFVSHKLGEVISLCSRVVVLQHGKISGERNASQTSASDLAQLMVGREVDLVTENIPQKSKLAERSRRKDDTERLGTAGRAISKIILEINNLNSGVLKDFGLQVNAGEIVGLAGVDGNGQRELFEALAGLTTPETGAIKVHSSKPPAFVPPDRGTEGLIPSLDIAENLALNGTLRKQAKSTFWFNWKLVQNQARQMMADFDVRAPQTKERTLANQLSGGNQQKVVLARALQFGAELIVAVNPTHGLDVAAAAFVHEQLRLAAADDKAILLISTDLDEIIALSDRIGVLYEGQLLPDENLLARGADRQIIGELMGGKFK
ncbi:MAG: ABC transporter ATP-binding protein [Abditibacteriaceae bacterium]